MKTYVVVLIFMSTHNICFCEEISKISIILVEKKSILCGAMLNVMPQQYLCIFIYVFHLRKFIFYSECYSITEFFISRQNTGVECRIMLYVVTQSYRFNCEYKNTLMSMKL